MRGWTWAGPGQAGFGCNYREDIWEHVGAQMAENAADLQQAGLAAVCVCVWCVHAAEALWLWPTSNK